jgi:isopenicillin N synthase-like dioxygenase
MHMEATLNALPVIDLAPLRSGSVTGARGVARQIDEACTEIGFFLVAGHGIPATQIAATRQAAVDFFALALEEKMTVQRPPAKISRGYNWVGDRSLSYSLGQAAPPDIQEAFAFGPEDAAGLVAHVGPAAGQMYAPNIWPERPPHFRTVMLSYYNAMADLAAMVLRAMAITLEVDESYFVDKFDRGASVARMIRYPAVTQSPLPGQLRAGAHTDYGTMTFVRGDDTPGGLQVQHRQGGWIDVHIPPDQFCCNIGDLMARWSNNRWVSTLHRVAVPPPDAALADRISLVFFQNPNPDTIIRCFESCRGRNGEENYPATTVAEHYLGKLMKAAHSRLDAEAGDAVAASPR